MDWEGHHASLAAQGVVVATFPKQSRAINIIANEYGGPSLDVFRIKEMGPRIDIVKLP